MTLSEDVKPKGRIQITIDYSDGRQQEKYCFDNAVLRKGREAIAAGLANSIGDSFNFYIDRMIFGDGGTLGGVPKFVNTERNGLFGTTRANKTVIATIDSDIPSQVIFTSVLGYDEANGYTLNEMALKLGTGDLYSMATFPDVSKTSSMQITWNWNLYFV